MYEELFRMVFLNPDDGAGDGGEPEPQEPDPVDDEPKFTQKDLTRISTDSRKKGQRQALKELGIDDPESFKDWMAKAKEREEADKTESQKLQDLQKTLKTQLDDEKDLREKAELKVDAMIHGVDPKKVDRAVKLAKTYEGETPEEKIKALLEDIPELKAKDSLEGPPNLSKKTGNVSPDEKETAKQKVRLSMGLKS